MADDDLTLPPSTYVALLARHPWIKSRAPYAYLCRGWERLMGEMLGAMDGVMAEVVAAHPGARVVRWSTKEKLGGLSVHYELKGAPPDVRPALREPVDRAEEASTRTCERCGAPGRTRDVDGWLTTLCDGHAAEREEGGGRTPENGWCGSPDRHGARTPRS